MANKLKSKDGTEVELPDTRDGHRSAEVIIKHSGGYWSRDRSKAATSDDAKAADTKPKGGGS